MTWVEIVIFLIYLDDRSDSIGCRFNMRLREIATVSFSKPDQIEGLSFHLLKWKILMKEHIWDGESVY
jgi:hypothetical protein